MDMRPVESSNVESVGYNPETETLHVRYKNGSLYEYAGVPQDTHEELMAAESVGQHLAQNVKGKFEHTQIE